MPLSKQDILTAKVQTEEVQAPELGGDGILLIRSLRAIDASAISEVADRSKAGESDPAEPLAVWCELSLCDADGKRLFEGEGSRQEMLKALPFNIMHRVAEAAMTLNGVPEDADSSAGNSDDGPSDDSPSD